MLSQNRSSTITSRKIDMETAKPSSELSALEVKQNYFSLAYRTICLEPGLSLCPTAPSLIQPQPSSIRLTMLIPNLSEDGDAHICHSSCLIELDPPTQQYGKTLGLHKCSAKLFQTLTATWEMHNAQKYYSESGRPLNSSKTIFFFFLNRDSGKPKMETKDKNSVPHHSFDVGIRCKSL